MMDVIPLGTAQLGTDFLEAVRLRETKVETTVGPGAVMEDRCCGDQVGRWVHPSTMKQEEDCAQLNIFISYMFNMFDMEQYLEKLHDR